MILGAAMTYVARPQFHTLVQLAFADDAKQTGLCSSCSRFQGDDAAYYLLADDGTVDPVTLRMSKIDRQTKWEEVCGVWKLAGPSLLISLDSHYAPPKFTPCPDPSVAL